MQTLTQLRAFVAVARNGSVQVAARELFLTQPSISSAVAALSRELGAELFERNGRGVRLTQAGHTFLPYATRMLGLVEEGRAAVHYVTQADTDVIRLIAASTAGDYFLPALIQCHLQHAKTNINLTVAHREKVLNSVSSHEADVGITGPLEAGSPSNLVGTAFLANELIVVARRAPVDLLSVTWLLREEGSTLRSRTERLLSELALEPSDALTLGSSGAVKQALMLGLGVTLIPRIIVARELESGDLEEVPAVGTPVQSPWHAVVASDVPLRPVVKAFIGFLNSSEAQDLLRRGWS